jgi:hypothetical protein
VASDTNEPKTVDDASCTEPSSIKSTYAQSADACARESPRHKPIADASRRAAGFEQKLRGFSAKAYVA